MNEQMVKSGQQDKSRKALRTNKNLGQFETAILNGTP